MAEREHRPVARTPLNRDVTPREVPFPDGVAPSLNVDQVRQDILRRLTSAPTTPQTRDADASAHTTDQTRSNGEKPASAEASTEALVPAVNKETFLQRSLNRAKELLMKLGENLRRIPGVEACIAGAARAIEFVTALFAPPRELPKLERALNRPDSNRSAEESPSTRQLDNTATPAIIELEVKPWVDPLEGSKQFHAAIVKAAHELGERAQREHEKKKKEARARLDLEQGQARKAEELVRQIDQLSGAANGETQAIISKLRGPFAISLDEALRLALEAEKRELSTPTTTPDKAVGTPTSSAPSRKATTLAV
jgi:hypothetical protein